MMGSEAEADYDDHQVVAQIPKIMQTEESSQSKKVTPIKQAAQPPKIVQSIENLSQPQQQYKEPVQQ